MRVKVSALVAALLSAVALPGFRNAKLEVPAALRAVTPLDVVGHQVRTLNKPMSFGPYRAGAVREGVEFSWLVEAFGVRGGSASKRYRFVLESPEKSPWEVECRNRGIEAWRGGWTVELTDAFSPRLACGLNGDDKTLRLVLGSRAGIGLRGAVVRSDGDAPLLAVRSLHKLEGSPLRIDEPAGYVLERDGRVVGAVETLNRGRVWLAEDLDGAMRRTCAAVATALLLYKLELTPQVD